MYPEGEGGTIMVRLLFGFLVLLVVLSSSYSIEKAGREHGGEVITADLPDEQHTKNTVGTDGQGLCVFHSIRHGARYQIAECLEGLVSHMEKQPGGGYPEKVDKVLKEYFAKNNCRVEYLQHTGGDMEFLRLALRTGRYPSVTYSGNDGVYYRSTVSHMVNLVHLSDRFAVIHDNNYPRSYLWMTPAEFKERWLRQSGGWAVVLLSPPPSPIPSLSPSAPNRPQPIPTILLR
jgi:hypothetical protein